LIDKINGFVSWLVGGIPTILLLMVLYYLIFVDWATIDGIWVAIIGFTILFGYTVLEILTTSVSAIGKGQEEGARALGYNSTQTFFHVILPQALRVAFPQIKSELVSLIKETSIVGYISIADLTRMSDIVRGRTYEAFFPLITTDCSLHEIDLYAQQCIRTLSTGKHTKGAFNFRYEDMKTLGYITLVNRYYCHKSAESKE
jgi:ABC-type amino acid transport system permease subunit